MAIIRAFIPQGFRPRRRFLASALGAVTLALSLSACTGGPGSEEDLVAALTRAETFSEDEAQCIAKAVFAEYGEDDDALKLISAAATFEELVGTEGVEGFKQTFDNALSGCANL